jgi:RNA polymerase sigma factor (sigma-70 family)
MTRLTIDDLAIQCQKESHRLRPVADDAFSACWELFRRAVVEDDQRAWRALYAQYRRLVGKWAMGSTLTLDDLVHEAFARFWQGVRDSDFTARFPTIRAVMGYLKRCARTLAIDAARRREHQRLIQAALTVDVAEDVQLVDDPTPERIYTQELRAYLASKLNDEDERVVFHAYCLGLPPREIAGHYPERFPDVRKVYRIRERIVSRLSNDPVLQEHWEP